MPDAAAKPDAYRLAVELIARLCIEDPALIPPIAAMLPALQPCRHGGDFASVVWFGTPYTFTPAQSKVIQKLWDAWKNGTPDVRATTLMLASASDADDLAEVFADSPAWGALVVPGTRTGTYRLRTEEAGAGTSPGPTKKGRTTGPDPTKEPH